MKHKDKRELVVREYSVVEQANREDATKEALGPVREPKRSTLSVLVHGWGGTILIGKGAGANTARVGVGVNGRDLDAHFDTLEEVSGGSHADKLQWEHGW